MAIYNTDVSFWKKYSLCSRLRSKTLQIDGTSGGRHNLNFVKKKKTY